MVTREAYCTCFTDSWYPEKSKALNAETQACAEQYVEQYSTPPPDSAWTKEGSYFLSTN